MGVVLAVTWDLCAEMLIIAMPKSASSSLLHTLADTHALEIPDYSQLWLSLPFSGEFPVFHRQHGYSMRELDVSAVKAILRPNIICRAHILPSRNNQDLLRNKKKVILLRDPAEVVRAYRRGTVKGTHYMQSVMDFAGCQTEEDWLERAQRNGLMQDIVNFHRGWMDHEGEKLAISFDDLVSRPKKVTNKIEEYYDLPISKSVQLKKHNYSRIGPIAILKQRIRNAKRRFLYG